MHATIGWLKNQYQSGEQEPEQIDRALNNASNDKFNEEKRIFERDGYISDNLHNFKKFDDITIASGFGDLPEDYAYRTGASFTNDDDEELEVEIVPESEWINRKNDPIDPPNEDYPICAIREQLQVVPDITPIKLYYLRKPVIMQFAYTTSGNDLIYDAGSSVDCDWPEDCHTDLILRACPYLGIPLNDDMMVKIKAYKKQTENV